MVYLCNTPWIIHNSIAILNDCSPNVLSTKSLNSDKDSHCVATHVKSCLFFINI
jgi:hypothetical protein